MGICYKLEIDDIPEKRWRENGVSLGALSKDADKKEKIVSIFVQDGFPIGEAIFFTQGGMVKRTGWNELDVSKSSYKVINLTDDELINVEMLQPECNVFTATEKGLSLVYELSEIPVQGRNAGGVKSIQLNDGDKVVFAGQITDEGEILVVSDSTFAKRIFAFSFDVLKRYRKGVKLIDMPDANKVVLVDYVKEPYEIALVDEDGKLQGFSTEQIDICARTTRGKQLIKTNKKQNAYKHIVDYDRPLNA